jgi:RNA polymerase sigma factor (sigma-70 family)
MVGSGKRERPSTRENLLASHRSDAVDRELVERSTEGDRKALRRLIERHQPFVFNLAIRMFGTRADAEDATQEVFVKAITSLGTFRYASSFRTWLYRITVNHCVRMRRRTLEKHHTHFEEFFDELADVPDEEPSAALGVTDETVEELRIRCTTGMLMCLDREQRITFILGAVFGVPQEIASEILGVSPGNYRVRLHRARQDLYNWMTSRCGLVEPRNPCRCRRKTNAFVKAGLVDPERLVFNTDYLIRIDALTRHGARQAMERVDDIYERHERLFRDQPFFETRQTIVDDVLGDPTLRDFFDLERRSPAAPSRPSRIPNRSKRPTRKP